MKIVKLKAENIKKLVAVEITPEGNVVKISGKNGAGKTSVLDSIFWALAGTENIQSQPLRQGTTKGKVTLDLGDMIVNRTFTENGSSLVVENKDGLRFKSPQTMLDTLLGRLSFDPLQFMRMEPREQFETLRELTGLDLSKLDRKREAAYQKRTEINRDIKSLKARMDAIELIPDYPREEVSIAKLTEELREAQTAANDNRVAREGLQRTVGLYETEKAHIVELTERVSEIQAQIDNATKTLCRLEAEIADGRKQCESLIDPDLNSLAKKISEAETTNRLARQYKEKLKLRQEYDLLNIESSELTKRIEECEFDKENAIRNAKMPLEGLSFSDGSVLYNGLPIEQISSAEQLKISMAMAMAMNPKLRVIRITDGSLLDSESMKTIESMSKEKDYQVWIEIVDESGRVGIVIDEGQVIAGNKMLEGK